MQDKLIILQKNDGNKSNIFMGNLLGITGKQYAKKVKNEVAFTLDEMFALSEYYTLPLGDIFLPRLRHIGYKEKIKLMKEGTTIAKSS